MPHNCAVLNCAVHSVLSLSSQQALSFQTAQLITPIWYPTANNMKYNKRIQRPKLSDCP